MSWADLRSGEPSLRTSPLESRRFGHSVARAAVPLDAEADSASILALTAGATEDVVVLRYPAARVELYAELAAHHDTLLADTLVYWRLRTGAGRRPAAEPGLVGAEEPLDGVDTSALVGEIFTGYGSHYLANPLFDAEAALAGYREWATASVARTPPVVLRQDGEPIAIATVDRASDHLEIELAGVRPGAQRGGRYAHLLAAVEDVAEGLPEVVISTQGHNVNVQRAWARYGFEPVAAFVTVHLMARRDGSGRR